MKKVEIKRILLIISFYIIINFYYKWLSNIPHHIDVFFGVEISTFLGVIALIFWGIVCICSGLILMIKILLTLSNVDDTVNLKDLSYVELERNIISIFKNIKFKSIAIIGVIFLLIFSSSTFFYSNYIGLRIGLDEDEFTEKSDAYEYVENKYSISNAENLYYYDNDLISNESYESKNLENIKNLFSKERFLLKETGVLQGYNAYNNEEGFISYVKCLLFSFMEISIRATLFFSISGIPILILISLYKTKNNKNLSN